MKTIALAFILSLVGACVVEPDTVTTMPDFGPDAIVIVEESTPDTVTTPDGRPDPEPLPACVDVADTCDSMAWYCLACGEIDPVCWCDGESTIRCVPECGL